MANYLNQLMVYVDGKRKKIGAADNIEIGGGFTAGSFSGDGASLTNLNASNLAFGEVADGLLSSNVAKYSDTTVNFASGAVTALSFSGSGSGLTDISVTALVAAVPGDTISDSLLSSNVPLKNAALNAFSGNMTVGGNLTVTGKIVSAGSAEVILKDQFIDLVGGNTVFGAVLAGGMAINVECLTATPFTATTFDPGSSIANPIVTVDEDASGLLPGDLIQISGTTDSLNDGQYVVQSVSGTGPTYITVKGTALMPVSTSSQTPFAHNQFSTQSSQTAALVKIRVSAFSATNNVLTDSASAAIPTGSFCFASGSTEADFIDGWTNVDPGAVPAVTLQGAYNASADPVTIETTAAKGGFTVKPATGELAGLSLQGAAASDITVDGATLDISASRIDLSAGNVAFEKAGEIAGVTTGALAEGTICYINSSGAAAASDNESLTDDALTVDGVITADADHLGTVFGTKMVVAYAGAAPAIGDLVYLSGGANAGKCQKAVPTAGRVTSLGKCVVSGVAGLCTIVWSPDYIADL